MNNLMDGTQMRVNNQNLSQINYSITEGRVNLHFLMASSFIIPSFQTSFS